MTQYRFFGPCVDGPWKGREIKADAPALTIPADAPGDAAKPVEFMLGAYCFVHGALGQAGEWRWRGPSKEGA